MLAIPFEREDTKNEKKVFFGSTFKDPATMMHYNRGGMGEVIPLLKSYHLFPMFGTFSAANR